MKDKGCFTIGCGAYLLLTLIMGGYASFFYEDDKKETVKTEQVKKDSRQAKANVTFKPAVIKTDVVKSEFLGDIEVQHVVLPRSYTIDSQFGPTVKAGEKVKALFYIVDNNRRYDHRLLPVVENSRGERYALYVEDSDDFDKILLKPLKVLNPEFHHYVGGTFRQTDNFVYGLHISDVVKKWGEYTYMQKQKDGTYQYGFSHITRAQGISRSHTFYCNTDANGYVVTTQDGHESSNLFGYLFFYADILSLNIFSSYEPVMYDNKDEYLDSVDKSKETVAFVYIAYSLIAALLASLILCAVARIKMLSNNAVLAIFYTVFIILQYILLVALLEYYHGWWVLLLMFLPGLQLMFVAKICEDGAEIKYRCPLCHRMNAVSYKSQHTGENKYLKGNITFGYPKYTGGLPTYSVKFTRGEEKETNASCKYCSYVKLTYADDERLVTTCPDCGKPLRECAIGADGEIGTVDFYNLKSYVSGDTAVLEFDCTYKAQCSNCKWTYQMDERHFDVEKRISPRTSNRRPSASGGDDKKSGAGFGCKHLRTQHVEGSLRGYYYCEYSHNNNSTFAASNDDCCKCMRGCSNCSDYERW